VHQVGLYHTDLFVCLLFDYFDVETCTGEGKSSKPIHTISEFLPRNVQVGNDTSPMDALLLLRPT